MTGEKKRPEKCNLECFECLYTDCIYDGIEFSERREQDKFDKGLEVVEPEVKRRREVSRRYSKTDKGRDAQKRYAKTEKFKNVQKKYLSSEKGMAKKKRDYEKKIESGRNAAACRRYYQRHKEEIKEKARERYRKNQEEIKLQSSENDRKRMQ